MFTPTTAMIRYCVKRLEAGYRQTYGNVHPLYPELIGQTARLALQTIARTDALYHNVEHTILVALVGQEILRGKQIRAGNVSEHDWVHFIVSLLCHDIGYVKGVCSQDQPAQRTYTTGIGNEMITLELGATDASLTPYHVDRGQRFVEEAFAAQNWLDLAVINHNLDFTRFPVPKGEIYQNTTTYAGLARAADLIGQLSDPRYLEKIPALFYEFEEVGTNHSLGYRHPEDLRAGYPKFFRTIVCPYIQGALPYLAATRKGRHILTNLNVNVATVEQELLNASGAHNAGVAAPRFFQPVNPGFWGHSFLGDNIASIEPNVLNWSWC